MALVTPSFGQLQSEVTLRAAPAESRASVNSTVTLKLILIQHWRGQVYVYVCVGGWVGEWVGGVRSLSCGSLLKSHVKASPFLFITADQV